MGFHLSVRFAATKLVSSHAHVLQHQNLLLDELLSAPFVLLLTAPRVVSGKSCDGLH